MTFCTFFRDILPETLYIVTCGSWKTGLWLKWTALNYCSSRSHACSSCAKWLHHIIVIHRSVVMIHCDHDPEPSSILVWLPVMFCHQSPESLNGADSLELCTSGHQVGSLISQWHRVSMAGNMQGVWTTCPNSARRWLLFYRHCLSNQLRQRCCVEHGCYVKMCSHCFYECRLFSNLF